MACVVVGLGNPGSEYRGTRHNFGQRVVDWLAERLHRSWRRQGQVMIARGQWRGTPLVLVKPLTFMNVSGPVVARTLRQEDAEPADLILVYDDLDLPLATVRVRMKGSHGGHHGVRSVIEALGTNEIRRVKIGIGRPGQKEEVSDHVLTPFLPEELSQVDAAVAAAAERVLELVARPGRDY